MKSKEALRKICDYVLNYDPDGFSNTIGIEFADEYGIIKQDLEILEIIKNKLVFLLAIMYLSYETYNALMDEKQNLTQEEYNKLKEWLECN